MKLLKLIFAAFVIVMLLMVIGIFSDKSAPRSSPQPTATGSNPAASSKADTPPQPTPASATSEPTSADPQLQPPPASPQPVDLNNADSLDQRYGIAATSHCEVEADDYLRSVSKYDFKWEKTGWLEEKFDKYMRDVPAPGVLVMVSNKVMLQNGFGAFQRVDLQCAYDTQAKTTAFTIIQ